MNPTPGIFDSAPVTKPHLLVVDDEIEVAKALQRQFRQRYQVHIATNAEEAFQVMNQYPIQIVISDQRMPGITGVEFFARIKHTNPDTIRLLLTGYADIEAVIAAVNDGSIFRYIKKPWDRVELDNVLQEAYEQHFLITENKRLVKELRQSEQRYRALFESSPIAMLELDVSAARQRIGQLPLAGGETLSQHGDTYAQALTDSLNQITVLDHNRAVAHLLPDQDQAEVSNLLHTWLVEDLAEFMRSWLMALQDGQLVWHQDVTLHTEQTDPVHLFAHASIVPSTENTWDRSILTLTDITERKQAEQAIQRALDRETELNTLRSAIIETISHEFRTPLSIIQSTGEILTNYAEQLNTDQRQRYAHNLKSSIAHLTALIDDVSTFSKIEKGQIEIRRRPVDLEALCRQLIEELAHTQMAASRITLTCKGDCAPVPVDEMLVTRVMRHLLANAIKFSAQDKTIDVTITYEETQSVICVSDSGVGIPTTDQPRIFDAFVRGSNKGTRQGIGLGLALVKQFVELHGGSVSITSEEGQGTSVCVTFPLFSTPV